MLTSARNGVAADHAAAARGGRGRGGGEGETGNER